MRLLLIGLLFAATSAETECQACFNGLLPVLKSWCVERQTCGLLIQLGCQTSVFNKDNCPVTTTTTTSTTTTTTTIKTTTLVPPIYNTTAYTDKFARQVALPYIAATFTEFPEDCLKNQISTTKFIKTITADCPNWFGLPDKCAAYIAVDNYQKAIIVAFKGVTDPYNLTNILEMSMSQWFNSGFALVGLYYKESVTNLMEAGLERDLKIERDLNPDYDLWVFGHSIGGAQAALFAVVAVENSIFASGKVKLLTFGQPMPGNINFIRLLKSKVPFSYGVWHNRDPVPAYPSVPYRQYTEIMYDNDMGPGANYVVCDRDCDDFETLPEDNEVYFTKNLADWGAFPFTEHDVLYRFIDTRE